MVGVEGEVVEVEEAQPVSLTDVGVAADGVVLVRDPHDQDDVKRRRRVVKEFGHDGFHSCGSQQKWCLNMYFSDMWTWLEGFLSRCEKKKKKKKKDLTCSFLSKFFF